MQDFPCPSCREPIAAGSATCPRCGREPVVCGEYRVEELLGRGGMGMVLGAVRLRDGARVAVKTLTLARRAGEAAPAPDDDWKTYELFERGTRVLQQLVHAGLPRVHAFAHGEDGTLWLVRDRFEGGTLGQRARTAHLAPEQARALLERLLELLVYLHGRVPAVLHRDIKPDNIMFRAAGDWEPVLVDFDTVAAPGAQEGRLTLVVSPGYTAPEQLVGAAEPASDLYSLGATMLFVVTREEPDRLRRKQGRFDVARQLGALDERTRAVVLRLVEPDLARRYASAAEALRDLRARPSGPEVKPAPVRGASGDEEEVGGVRKLLSVLATLLVLAAVGYALNMIWAPELRPWVGTRIEPQYVREVALVDGPDGPILAALDDVLVTRFWSKGEQRRLVVIDARTGGLRSEQLLGERELSVHGLDGYVMWLAGEPCVLECRDVRSGALLVDVAGLVRENPALGRGATCPFTRLGRVEATGELALETPDGFLERIASGSWRASRLGGADEVTWGARGVAGPLHQSASSVRVGDRRWVLDGDARRALAWTQAEDRHDRWKPVVGSDTFLEGGFVTVDRGAGAPWRFPGSSDFLVAHRSQLGEDGEDRLSRVGVDGKTRWTWAHETPPGNWSQAAGIYAGNAVLLVVVRAGTNTLVAIGIDVERGRDLWETPL